LNIVVGLAVGAVGGLILSLTKLWDTPYKRSVMLVLLAVVFKFGFKQVHFDGAGALSALVMAAVAAQCWHRGVGGCLSLGEDDHAAHDAEAHLCKLWRVVSEPLLFSVIGSALDFSALDPGTIPKAVLLVVAAVLVRTVAAGLATYGAGLTSKERLFIALAWTPKATVQAALGGVPLSMIRERMVREDDPAKYDRYVQHGVEALTAAVFAILITAPVGLIVIEQLGPRWLHRGPLVDVVKVEEDVRDDGDAVVIDLEM